MHVDNPTPEQIEHEATKLLIVDPNQTYEQVAYKLAGGNRGGEYPLYIRIVKVLKEIEL